MASDTEQGPDPDNQHKGKNGSDDGDGSPGIAIKLTPSQINRVIRDASDGGNMTVLLFGQMDMQEMLERKAELLGDRHISRSLMRGLLILAALYAEQSYIGVVELGERLEMSASTTHRYLNTFVLAGLVERDPSSRKYRLAR